MVICRLVRTFALLSLLVFTELAGTQPNPPGDMHAPDFGALTRRDVERLVLERNREVQQARRALEVSDADAIAAGAAPNPTLTLGAGFINPQSGLSKAAVPGSVRIEQVIERGNKRELRVAAASHLQAAAAADLVDQLRQQQLAGVSAYYDLMQAQDALAIASQTAALYGKSVQATALRLKTGDVAPADLSRLRVDALRAENDVRAAEADRSQAQLALAYLIGAGVEATTIRAADTWPSSGEGRLPEINDATLDRRPDVAAAKRRAAAAAKARELAHGLKTRDVTVGAELDRYPPSETNTLGAGTTVGVTLSIPLFVRYAYEGEIARAEAEFNAAREQLELVRARARTELGTALSNLRSAGDRIRRYDAGLVVEARKAADYAEFAYRNGAIGVLDVLDARRTLRAVLLDAGAARADYAKALARWQSGLLTVGPGVDEERR